MKNPTMQSFMDGIAFFFGVGDNPIEMHYHELVRKRKERTAQQRNGQSNGISGFELDAHNLRSDWERVGIYLNNAIGQYERETANTNG